MYVHADVNGAVVDTVTGSRSAYLYFDLDNKRYRIESARAGLLSNSLTLQLGDTSLTAFNGS